MQIALDTNQDSPQLLLKLVELLQLAASERESATEEVPAGTLKVSEIVDVTVGSITASGNIIPIRSEIELEKMFGEEGEQVPRDAMSAGFGKSPLPADAIATDLPASFTAPAGTSAVSVAGNLESAPPAPMTTPPSVLPATTIAAASPVPAPPANVSSANVPNGGHPAPASSTETAPAVAQNPTTAPAYEEDSAGYVWDARIHSSNHKKYPDGTWMKRRGVSPETVAAVKAELRAAEVPATPAFVAGAVDNPEVSAKVDAAMLAATSPVVPPPPPPPVVTPATAQTLNFTPTETIALAVPPPPPPPQSPAAVEGPTAQPASTIAAVPAAPGGVSIAQATVPAVPPPPPVYAPAAVVLAPVPAPPAVNASGAMTSPSSEVIDSYKSLMDKVVNPAIAQKKITPLDLREMCKQISTPEDKVGGLQDLIPTHPRINDFANLVRAKAAA